MKVLAIGDLHLPVAHPGYLQFCKDLYKEWDCDTVVFIGDVADQQAISFHAANPECPGPTDEFALTKQQIAKWHKAFPVAKVCLGNHDMRVLRLAESVNIPSKYLRNHSDVWSTPKWDWQYSFIIDGVYYFHGEGTSGLYPAANATRKLLCSVVMGHTHAASGIYHVANPLSRTFGLDVGCGIDVRAFQFAYGKHYLRRPILSAGIILDGTPYHEVMKCGRGELYHHSNFK